MFVTTIEKLINFNGFAKYFSSLNLFAHLKKVLIQEKCKHKHLNHKENYNHFKNTNCKIIELPRDPTLLF